MCSPNFLEDLCGRADFFGKHALCVTSVPSMTRSGVDNHDGVPRIVRAVRRQDKGTGVFLPDHGIGILLCVSVALPSFIWLAINNWDVGETNMTGITLAECISLSGYSLIIMIPAYIPL